MSDNKHSKNTGQKVHVAVIGCGGWGMNQVRVFSELDALSAVVEVDLARGKSVSDEFCVPLQTYDEILADNAITAVVIAASAHAHFDLARKAVIANKHVLVEKPMALTLNDAVELEALANNSDKVFMVGHLLRYHPAFQTLQDVIADGRLGKIRYVYSNRLSFGKFRHEENILWSFAPHDISMILAIIKASPERVYAEGAKFIRRDVADTTTTTLTFPGGEHAHIFVSWLHPYKDQRLVVIGENGMITFNDNEPWEQKIALYMHKIDWKDQTPTPNKADVSHIPVENVCEPLKAQASHFLDCINTGKEPITSASEGLKVLEVLDAADRSMNSGSAVMLGEQKRDAARNNLEGVHATAVVDQPVMIGTGTKIWHFSHVLADAQIGQDCTIGQNVMIGRGVVIGDRCKIQNNVSVYEGVTLEDGVFCGPSCVFTNVLTPRAEIERKDEFLTTIVHEGASIGANATIVSGNSIGRYAMVGAGAVVTSNVPDYALVTGIPARRTGWVSSSGEVLDQSLKCPRTGTQYHEVDDQTLREISNN